jgi:NitT/TauT family transport system permease protein
VSRYIKNSHIQSEILAMNIFIVSFLAIFCTSFIISNIFNSLSVSVFCRVSVSISNTKIEYLHFPNAFGETINNLQKLKIKDIPHGSSNNNSTMKSSNNNSDNKKQGSIRNWNINLVNVLVDSASSVYRMFAALGLSFVAAIIIGITAARKPLASKIIIPIIDILQSVPILGFFPAAIAFFITLFNGSSIGIEMAAIFLIFTSMAWNMIFSVYESVLSIPSELLETSYAYRANPFLQLRRLYLPASIPKLIYNSIMSWAAGWYFLTAAEIISLGSKTFTLRGLGSLLGNSVYSGQYIQAVIALAVLILIILLTDFFFWRPLESYAKRFKYDYSSRTTATTRRHQRHLGLYIYNENVARLISRSSAVFSSILLSDFLARNPRPLIYIKSNRLIEALAKILYFSELQIFVIIYQWFGNKRNQRLFGIIALSILTFAVILLAAQENEVIYKSFSALYTEYYSLYNNPQSVKIISQIPLALLLSYFRLTTAYLLALAWTIPVAIKIANNPRFDRILPLFQTFAAIPATAFFPFVIVVVNYVPGGFEFLSILLILTGMQWYILFNLIGGIRSIPGDIEETARAFRVTKGQYVKRVLFPSIYPSFITGSITGWGGGWNSLIVAEYLVFGYKTYLVLGMGSLLDKAAYNIGNTILILLIVGIMSAIIVMINRLVWRRLYRKVIRKYSMSI